jgi:uncharacterized short protein YbdD (DUF466 family)
MNQSASCSKKEGKTLLIKQLAKFWRLIREMSGDDAYERYLRHHANAHPKAPLLDPQAFFKQEQARKWSGVNRCC